MGRDKIISPYIWELEKVLKALERTNCMMKTFYEIHSLSVLSKYALSCFDKAIFQCPAHNSKSLIAILSPDTKFIFSLQKRSSENK
jgi:hypothetical protein